MKERVIAWGVWLSVTSGFGIKGTSDPFIDLISTPRVGVGAKFSAFGNTHYSFLNPGYQWIYSFGSAENKGRRVVSVLNQTREFRLETPSGLIRLKARKERTEDRLISGFEYQVTERWMTRHEGSGNVFLLGVKREVYRGDQLISQEGSWEMEGGTAVPGLQFPGTPLQGSRYWVEQVSGNVRTEAVHLGRIGLLETPLRLFEDVERVEHRTEGLSNNEVREIYLASQYGVVGGTDDIRLEEFWLGQQEGVPAGCEWSDLSTNPYFPLYPGMKWRFRGETGEKAFEVQIEVLPETKNFDLLVDGNFERIPTRVVLETEQIDGAVFEVTRNYYGQCLTTGDVYYFGEEVRFFENGELLATEGWIAGEKGANPGIFMPCYGPVGVQYFQEKAPGVALDMAKHISLSESREVSFGRYSNCLLLSERNLANSADPVTLKYYAPGVGLIEEVGLLELVEFSDPRANVNSPVLIIEPYFRVSWWSEQDAWDLEESTDGLMWILGNYEDFETGFSIKRIFVPDRFNHRFFRLSKGVE